MNKNTSVIRSKMKNKNIFKGIFKGFVAFFLFLSISVNSQSLTGTRGLIKAPTARMYESGTLAIGMGYVPAKFFKRTYGKYQGLNTGNSGLNTFLNFNILPFMEIMFRYSHELNLNVSPQTGYFPDRMFSARLKLFNESKFRPSTVIGLQDVSSAFNLTLKQASNFSSLYIVGSKNLIFNKFIIDLSLGYSGDFINIESNDFKGVFGGLELNYKNIENIQLLIDYDTTSLNIGIQGFMFNRIHTVLGLMDFQPMFILAYRYKL